MTVSSQCVRISLFQCTPPSAASGQQSHSSLHEEGRLTAKEHLFRSRRADYRGDVLIPLASIALSSLPPVDEASAPVTLRQLRDGLESRLSAYCVLHVPTSRARRFAEEHLLTPSSVSLSPPAAESSAPEGTQRPSCADEKQSRDGCAGEPLFCSDSAKFRCCASCSSSVVAEAAIISRKAPTALRFPPAAAEVASDFSPNAPWIRIHQLQHMTARRSDTTSQAPSSPASLQAAGVSRARTQPMLSADEWIEQQRGSADVFLTSFEAESIGVVAAEDADAGGEARGGACYAAFFSLTVLPAAERAARLMRSLAQSSDPALAPAAAAVPQHPAVFTVRAHQHTLRMGLPLPGSHGTSTTLPRPPTLREVIIDRLRLQRGVHVERLLDPESGAAVLPCEDAATLLSAQVVRLEAECGVPPAARSTQEEGLTQRLDPRSPQDAQHQAPSASTGTRTDSARAETAPDFFDHLANVGAHYHADSSYCNGMDAYDWAERRTLISLSELPSESELRLASARSRDPSLSSLYSSTPPSTVSSAETSSAASLPAENSSSQPGPLQGNASGVMLTAPSSAMAVTGSSIERRPHLSKSSGAAANGWDRGQDWKASDDQSGSPAFFSSTNAEEETAPLSPAPDNFENIRDSLSDMNDVFLYVDEETVMDAEAVDTRVTGDGSGDSQRREHRSSLVWSTPVARGSAMARMLSDTGFSATPLIYRTSTRLSLSPSTSPLTVLGEAETTGGRGQTTQRMILVTSPSSTASSSRPLGGDQDRDAASADEVTGGGEPCQLSRGASDVGGGAAVEFGGVAGEVHDSGMAAHKTQEGTHEACMSTASACAVPSASASSVMSTTGSSISSAPTRSSMSSSSRARSDRRWPVFSEATASERDEGAEAPSREARAATPSSLLGRVSSPALPSRKSSLSPLRPPKSRYADARVYVDEQTTSIAPFSTPLPSSPSSEHELRSRLHSMNPLATQDDSECARQGTPLADALTVVGQPGGQDGEGTPSCGHVGFSASERKRARVSQAIVLETSDSPPTAAARVEDAHTTMRLSSLIAADNSDGANTAHRSVSTPSTTVAARPLRRRSPIFFSPEEVSRMALNVAYSDSAQTPSSSIRNPVRGIAESDLGRAGEDLEQTPGHYGYGDYIASYTLPGSDCWSDMESNSEWGCRSRHSSATRSHHAASTPSSRGIVLQLGFRSSQRRNAPSPVAAMTTEEPAVETAAARRLWHTKRRRSSRCASALEAWVHASDEDTSCSVSDAGHHMLVTQQEIPVYSRHSSPSSESGVGSTESDAAEDSESDSSATQKSGTSPAPACGGS
ncbi:hypothetical protein LSCM1_03803 [Leishmania martiniquensis]|uniref:Uncharacterized protein n=1 Tax=Leishmania martiniquensis TaxID=1580590 RepID=A0A836GHS9_9TRYP|nr:hypothetical protein LSCM1_03803 [Leishmania martiniquensis]